MLTKISVNCVTNWVIEAFFFTENRQKMSIDEFASDTKFTVEEKFKKIAFNSILNIATFQLKNRLYGFQNVVDRFIFLHP